jgi:sugar phosphate isomerase/epimerase
MDVMVMKYGVVQGRLLPQVGSFIQNFPDNWMSEFAIAKSLGVSHIEWIDGAPNELISVLSGIDKLPDEVPVSAICLDWLVSSRHLTTHSAIIDGIQLLLTAENAMRLGIRKIVLPLLENASLEAVFKFKPHIFLQVIENINEIAKEFPSIMFSIESDLSVGGMKSLVNQLNHSNIGITFDTGNLTKLGYDLNEHLDVYGHIIDNIHIKDCVTHGTTVQLGTGDLDLKIIPKLHRLLNVTHMTFQTARAPGSEFDTFKHNVKTIEKVLCS